MNIINIMENVIDKYCANKLIILSSMGIVFFTIIVGGISRVKENRRYNVNKCIHNIFYAIMFGVIGELMFLLGLSPEIEYSYFGIIIYIIATGSIILYGCMQCIMFFKIKKPIVQSCQYIQYVTFFELFLLSIMSHLEMIEWTVGTLAIVCIEVLCVLFEKKKHTTNEENKKESDYPNADLYYTRQKQLEKFVPILQQQREEPYAVMISGEWGMGKSSFVNALEKYMKTDYFIWVETGSEKSVSEIMLEISEQVLDILKKNNIYIERGSLIEKYFLAFSGILDEVGLGFGKNITNIIGKNFYQKETSKEYINSKLKELNKTIYLVIDDLDRCDNEYQLKMFKVIRESTELINCKTIFLVDKKIFLNDKCDIGYIEKYVNYTLDLCQVEFKEITKFYIQDIFPDEYFQKVNSVLLQGRKAENIRNLISEFPVNILEILAYEIRKTNDEIKGTKDAKREGIQNKINDIKEKTLKIQNNISNSRKVKNYFKNIKRDISKLNNGIEQCSDEYLKEDWIKTVVEVEFMKCFLAEEFTNIQMCTDIYEYFEEYQDFMTEYIFDIRYVGILNLGKKVEILNYIIYKLDTIDFLEVKTQGEKYLNELYSDNAKFSHINEYISYAVSYSDYDKIFEVYTSQEFKTEVDKETFIKNLLNSISVFSSYLRTDLQGFLEFSRNLICVLKENGLSEKQKNVCVYEGRKISRKVILDNNQVFRNMLYILFGVDKVDRVWKRLNISDAYEFYTMLTQIDEGRKFVGNYKGTNHLLSIELFYLNLERELEKEEYENIEINFEKKFQIIRSVLEVCKFWGSIEKMLVNETNNVPFFETYFILDGGYSFTEEVFVDCFSLGKALDMLIEFYESKSVNYNSKYSLILLRVLYCLVVKYEEDESWFQFDITTIEDILESVKRLAELVYKYDVSSNQDDKDVVEQIRILVYRLDLSYNKNSNL